MEPRIATDLRVVGHSIEPSHLPDGICILASVYGGPTNACGVVKLHMSADEADLTRSFLDQLFRWQQQDTPVMVVQDNNGIHIARDTLAIERNRSDHSR